MYSCGNACVAFSGDGNIQEKICVNTRRKPCERCEKSADHEHGTFLSLKHWKGYYSKNRRSFFSDSLKHQNCIAIVVKRNFVLKSWAGNESAGFFLLGGGVIDLFILNACGPRGQWPPTDGCCRRPAAREVNPFSLRCHQTWRAGKSTSNGGFNSKTIL